MSMKCRELLESCYIKPFWVTCTFSTRISTFSLKSSRLPSYPRKVAKPLKRLAVKAWFQSRCLSRDQQIGLVTYVTLKSAWSSWIYQNAIITWIPCLYYNCIQNSTQLPVLLCDWDWSPTIHKCALWQDVIYNLFSISLLILYSKPGC